MPLNPDSPLRTFMVCVDYADLLSVTLPYNIHHFREVVVVTTGRDTDTIQVANENKVSFYVTDAFYRDGADFNKWLALEESLDVFGREGWICLMDADILWPKILPEGFLSSLTPGYLYTPLRRMCPPHNAILSSPLNPDLPPIVLEEKHWGKFPIHANIHEWAGYTQIFHSSDPVLGNPPWHETNWKHAGGADSFFQFKWPHQFKIRPIFDVLHIGEAGKNWCGRVTPYLSGQTPTGAGGRAARLRGYLQARRGSRAQDRYNQERLPGGER